MADKENSERDFDTQVAAADFHSLKPTFESKGHSGYVRLLVRELDREDPNAPRNLALTGGYGSGKSSILTQVGIELESSTRNKHDRKKAIAIALGTLDSHTARAVAEQPMQGSPQARGNTSAEEEEGASTKAVTNWMQREIVKQLLYRERATRLGGRFQRSEPFHLGRAIGWATAFTVVVGLIGAASGASKTLADSGLQVINPFATLLLAILLASSSVVVILRLAHGRFRIKALSAGGTGLTLENRSDYYFDEYLDEIVEFFRVSRTRVVFFEDLDRFRTPYIFETLHTLNSVLNGASQLKSSHPIKFVYAVRDSIFENSGSSKTGTDRREGNLALSPSELSETASTNRTKFFDLIVPIVPFISRENVRDVLEAQFSQGDGRRAELLALLSGHLSDMRTIKNIRNEYQVFIANMPHLTDLTDSGMLAMVVYKNLQLGEFEQIKPGRSRLNALRFAARRVATTESTRLAEEESRLTDQLAHATLAIDVASRSSKRLRNYFDEVTRLTGTSSYELSVSAKPVSPDSLGDPGTWHAIAEADGIEIVSGTGRSMTIPAARVAEIIGVELDATAWEERARASLGLEIGAKRREREFLKTASMRSLHGRRDLTFEINDSTRNQLRERFGITGLPTERINFQQLTAAILGSTLSQELVAAGFIDENFSLYVAKYYDERVSLNAKNFLVHNVALHDPDPFAPLSPEDIRAVIAEAGINFLSQDVAQNVSIFDYLLGTNESPIKPALERLSSGSPSDDAFVLQYLQNGAFPVRLIARLSPSWPGIFRFLAAHAADLRDQLPTLLNSALGRVGVETNYADGEEVVARLSRFQLPPLLTDPKEGQRVAAIRRAVRVMVGLGISFNDLTRLNETARSEVIELHAYPLSLPTLRAAVGSSESLTLEAIRGHEHVYAKVLGDLGNYLRLKPKGTRSVSSPEHFTEIVTEVAKIDESLAVQIIEDSAKTCKVTSLADIDESLWPTLVRTNHVEATAENVIMYLDRGGATATIVDPDLAAFLGSPARLKPGNVNQKRRIALALVIANAEALRVDTKIRRILNLKLVSALPAAGVTSTQRDLLGELLRRKVIADTGTNIDNVLSRDWPAAERYLASSRITVSRVAKFPLEPTMVKGILNSRSFNRRAQRVVFDRVIAGTVDQSAETFTAAANLVAENGLPISMADYTELTNQITLKGDLPARLILRLEPKPQAAALVTALTLAGGKYSSLAYRAHHTRSSIAKTPANRQLLSFLANEALVGEWWESRDGRRFVVPLRKLR